MNAKTERFPITAYVMVIAQGIGTSCAVLSVSIGAITAQFVTGSASLATIPYGLQFFTLFASTYLMSQLMARFGRRVIFISTGLIGVATAPLALFAIEEKSLGILIVAHVCLGIFLAALQLYRFAILDIAPPSKHARAVSLIMSGGIIAAFLGPTLLRNSEGFASDLFRGGYIAIGGLAFIVTVLIAFVRFPIVSNEKKVDDTSLYDLFKHPVFIFAAFTGGTVYGLMNAIMSASTLHMQHHGIGIPLISVVIQWHVFAMFAPSFISGFLIERIGISRFLVTGVFAMMISAALGFLQPVYSNFFITLLFLGIGWNFLYVGSTYLIGNRFQGEKKFKAQGLNDTIVHSCTASLGLSAGFLLATLSWQGMQILSLIVMTIVLAFLIVLHKKHFAHTPSR